MSLELLLLYHLETEEVFGSDSEDGRLNIEIYLVENGHAHMPS